MGPEIHRGLFCEEDGDSFSGGFFLFDPKKLCSQQECF